MISAHASATGGLEPAVLSARPDPELWSLVPPPEQADGWLRELAAGRSAAEAQRIVDAAILALRTQVETDAVLVFLFHDERAAILSSLTLFAYADVPPPSTAAEALRVAETLTSSPWPGEVVEATVGPHRGWRATVLDTTSDEGEASAGSGSADGVVVASWVSTLYFLDMAGGLVVAVVSPLQPEAAFLAQRAVEPVLATLEVTPA